MRVFALLVAATLLACGAAASARPRVIAHDRASAREVFGLLDLGDGSVTSDGAATEWVDCCTYAQVSPAIDPATRAVYVVAVDRVRDRQTLVRYPPTGAPTAVDFLPGTAVAALAWDAFNGRLVVLFRSDGSYRFSAFDAATARPVGVETVLPDCCIVRPRAADFDGFTLAFVAQQPANPGTWFLFRVNLGGGYAIEPLPAPVEALAWRPNGSLIAATRDAAGRFGLSYVIASPNLTLIPIGTPRAGCCVTASGAGYVEGGELVLVARDDADFAADGRLGLIAFNLTTGASRAISTFAPGVVANAVMSSTDAGAALPDALFRDSFESTATAGSADEKVAASESAAIATAMPSLPSKASDRGDTDAPDSSAKTGQGAAPPQPAAVPIAAPVSLAVLALLAWLSTLRLLRRNTRHG